MDLPSVQAILELHRELLSRTGGTPGILNLGTVDSALQRAAWGPFLDNPDMADRAALLLRGLCQDHPFADGNKRTAYEAVRLLASMNGWTVAATADDVVAFMLAVAQGRLDLAAIAQWLRSRTRKDEEDGGGMECP